MRKQKTLKPVPLALVHRSVWRRWRRWCVCGLRWRRCPDRRLTALNTRNERLPPYWVSATTDEYDQLARARVWRRRNAGHW
ncbi:hypothetical protein [Micromonospora zhanjiangensis]|uniref:Uncharacterized protein n=1 Tax=Micromonospora zhanjiangensis TaxID=1522057 RepID=A0ABV8KU32_9ACTN